MRRVCAPVLLAALMGAAVASLAVVLVAGRNSSSTKSTSAVAAGSSTTGTRRDAASTALTATQIYKQASAGVVAIKAATSQGADSGTGIVLNDKGLILTNDHVVSGADSLTVAAKGSSSETRTATLVGEEANDDLALIKVDPSGLELKPLTLASSKSVQVGDPVCAIGNQYGLDETLTRGIVSALGRSISAPNGMKVAGAIQTDAALNPGNSGGPLLDDEGQVIGANSQIASAAASVNGSQAGSTGVGFAVSSDTVAQAVKAIETGNGVPSTTASRRAVQSEGANETQTPLESGSGESQRGGKVKGGGGQAERPRESSGAEEGASGSGAVEDSEGRIVIVP